jgi:hypothetical protein
MLLILILTYPNSLRNSAMSARSIDPMAVSQFQDGCGRAATIGVREAPCAVRLTLDVGGLRDVNGYDTICVTRSRRIRRTLTTLRVFSLVHQRCSTPLILSRDASQAWSGAALRLPRWNGSQ